VQVCTECVLDEGLLEMLTCVLVFVFFVLNSIVCLHLHNIVIPGVLYPTDPAGDTVCICGLW
jgi:hypothetical protein